MSGRAEEHETAAACAALMAKRESTEEQKIAAACAGGACLVLVCVVAGFLLMAVSSGPLIRVTAAALRFGAERLGGATPEPTPPPTAEEVARRELYAVAFERIYREALGRVKSGESAECALLRRALKFVEDVEAKGRCAVDWGRADRALVDADRLLDRGLLFFVRRWVGSEPRQRDTQCGENRGAVADRAAAFEREFAHYGCEPSR
jgi:hypothetical protein